MRVCCMHYSYVVTHASVCIQHNILRYIMAVLTVGVQLVIDVYCVGLM